MIPTYFCSLQMKLGAAISVKSQELVKFNVVISLQACDSFVNGKEAQNQPRTPKGLNIL